MVMSPIGVGVAVGGKVGVSVGPGVGVTVGVWVAVGVLVMVGVRVAVGVMVAVGVGVLVAVAVGVRVLVAVGVGLGVGVGGTNSKSTLSTAKTLSSLLENKTVQGEALNVIVYITVLHEPVDPCIFASTSLPSSYSPKNSSVSGDISKCNSYSPGTPVKS